MNAKNVFPISRVIMKFLMVNHNLGENCFDLTLKPQQLHKYTKFHGEGIKHRLCVTHKIGCCCNN